MKVRTFVSLFIAFAIVATGAHGQVPAKKGSPPQGAPGPAPQGKTPASLIEVNQLGNSLFDAGKSSDWTLAAKKLTALKDAMKRMASDIPQPTDEQKIHEDQIDKHIVTLGKELKKKNQQPFMIGANRVARVSSVLIATFSTKVPQPVYQLQYLGREMLLWSIPSEDLTKLKALPARIDVEWAKISKDVAAKGGATQAKDFTAASAKAKAALTADDFAKAAPPILAAVDKLQSLFAK